MNDHSIRRLALIVSSAGIATGASAQCEPEWDTTLGNPGITTGYVSPIQAWNDGTGEKLYVGGSAENIGGGAANDYLAQYDPSTGQWSRVGLGIDNGSTNAFLNKIQPWDPGDGEKLYVAGHFASAGFVGDTRALAAWDGSNWHSVGAGFVAPNTVYDLVPADLDGEGEKLYLCGNFPTVGGLKSASGVALYDGEVFSTVGTGDGIAIWGGFSPFVSGLIVWDDGSGAKLYACGRFDGIDGAQAKNVARFDPVTSSWESFGQAHLPTSSTNNYTSWAVYDDGTGEALYLGGQTFRIAGDSQIYVVAKWDGTSWTGIGQTLSGRVTDLQVWNDGKDEMLYLSGTAVFEVNYFARLTGGFWQPVNSGINNPPVNGNFASAFGLGDWGNQLVVGGNFTQVGGFDPVTGVGSGTPIPARGLAAVSPCTCVADWDNSGLFNSADFVAYLNDYNAVRVGGSFTYNDPDIAEPIGTLNSADFIAYLNLYVVGCP